jgi:hypothetical protein
MIGSVYDSSLSAISSPSSSASPLSEELPVNVLPVDESSNYRDENEIIAINANNFEEQ